LKRNACIARFANPAKSSNPSFPNDFGLSGARRPVIMQKSCKKIILPLVKLADSGYIYKMKIMRQFVCHIAFHRS